MIKLVDRTIDDYGNVILTVDKLLDLIADGRDLHDFYVEESQEIEVFNGWCSRLDQNEHVIGKYIPPNEDVEEYHRRRSSDWMIPTEYLDLDVKKWLLEKCSSDIERHRVREEYDLFEQRDLIPLLQWLIFAIDQFRQNNVVWGVGRGSSVSSFVLFLIGVHKINSIKYDLDCSEFLKPLD